VKVKLSVTVGDSKPADIRRFLIKADAIHARPRKSKIFGCSKTSGLAMPLFGPRCRQQRVGTLPPHGKGGTLSLSQVASSETLSVAKNLGTRERRLRHPMRTFTTVALILSAVLPASSRLHRVTHAKDRMRALWAKSHRRQGIRESDEVLPTLRRGTPTAGGVVSGLVGFRPRRLCA
jgi:hypothetical protein